MKHDRNEMTYTCISYNIHLVLECKQIIYPIIYPMPKALVPEGKSNNVTTDSEPETMQFLLIEAYIHV